MFNNNLPVSSLFCKISLLVCLTVFLHAYIALSILLPFVLCTPFPFNAPFLFWPYQLLHFASFFLHASPTNSNNNLITSLCRVLIASVHLVHAICTMLLHLFTVSALSDHHYDFSASLAVFPPRVQHHWMSC
jgi:hypothetical protein